MAGVLPATVHDIRSNSRERAPQPSRPSPSEAGQGRRRLLTSYGIRPQFQPWRLAWEWPNAIRLSYFHPSWPIPSEIAAQYVLLLGEMKEHHALKLLYRATSHAPLAIRTALKLADPVAALPAARAENGRPDELVVAAGQT
jgi:hypothetical protein